MSEKTSAMFGRSLRRPGFPLVPVCAGIVVGYILRGLFDSTFLSIIEEKRYKKMSSEKESTPAHCKPCPLCALCSDCWRHDAIEEPYRPKTMYEVIRWFHFTEKHLYENLDDDPRIGLIGRWKEDVQDIQEQAVRIISKEEKTQWRLAKLNYGYKRIDAFRGMDYVLDMEVAKADGTEKGRKLVHLVRSTRPHVRMLSLQNVAQQTVVHFIVPLSRVTDRLRDFMKVYEKVCLESGAAVSLLGVLFRDSPEDQTSLDQYVEADGEFSRAVGLDTGARQLAPDALLFFCDIDVDFDQGFLQRCRNNAEVGRQVFYPAVFSQYDPDLVMEGIPGKPKPTNLRDINKYNDVKNMVFRAMDPALVHRYHAKTCDPDLTRDQYRMCVGALSETMASKAQLGVKLLTLQGKLPPAA
ncbi:chondroitin sulfate synthase 1-like [Branchiostoma floridae]|uniref:Hexosyltransferase n=1 Tax=Branchiostoma floridae TaxID=7739 RepID=A0A9J7N3B7_BRAFL|nr:chondroitin sulfate synthase 1-like [Branchiostoma floridae]